MTSEFSMKNLSFSVNYTQNNHNIHQTPLEYGHRQGRTYGPLVSFLLATFLTKAVAKYAASSFLPIFDQRPLLNNKPVNYLSFNQIQRPDQAWRPASPYLHGLTAFAAESYHDHYSPPDPFQTEDHHQTETPPTRDLHLNKYDEVSTTIESPDIYDQFPSQSQYSYRKQPPPNRWNYYPRRGYPPQRQNGNRFPNNQRNRYPSNRFRATTPYYDYYDNYDDLATRRTPYRTRRPPVQRRPTTENYDYLYDSSEYGDSSYDDYFERTTRFYEKTTKPSRRQKKPTKKTKLKKRTGVSEENVYSEESVEDLDDDNSKENVEFKPQQRQQTTTTESSTTTDTTESTTTETSTSSSTTSTTPATQNVTKPNGYGQGGNYDHVSFTYGPPVAHPGYAPPYNHHNGYGPSNGNEGISITQNPSTFPLFYHSFPYTNNLFPQELTKNAIVQKVHDIVGFEHDFVRTA